MCPDSSPRTDASPGNAGEKECTYVLCCDGAAIPIAGEKEMSEFYRGVGSSQRSR